MLTRAFWKYAAMAAAIAIGSHALAAEPVALTVHTDQPAGTISPRIYGQFLEHIFNSVHGGLWGDQIQNGTLELRDRARPWQQAADGTLSLAPVAPGAEIPEAPLFLGDAKWTDYDFSIEARKTTGDGGIMLYARAADLHKGLRITLGGHGQSELRKIAGNPAFWGPPEASAAGVITANQWYKIRIHCEGRRTTVFLDGTQILDWTDKADGNNAYTAGRIGIDARNAQIECRNLQVRALDANKPLLSSPLTDSALALAPFGWELVGSGRFVNDAVNKVNSDVSLRVEQLAGADVHPGIRQRHIALAQGEHYTLAMYLRGRANSAVEISLADGQGELFGKALGGLTPAWIKQDFEFSPARTAGNATLTIRFHGDTANIDQISLFSASALATGGYRPDLLKAVSDLKPATIRWPGGSFANNYLWQNGIGPREKRVSHPVEQWGDRDPNQFGTDEFLQLCEKIGAEPVLVINTTRGVDDALHWLEYCTGDANTPFGKMRASNGHAAPYKLHTIEIDNETWLLMRFPQYLEIVKQFCPPIRAKFPQLQLSVCGSYAFDDGPGEGVPENARWDQRLLDGAAKDFDILSPHYYNGLLKEHAPDCANDPRHYEEFIRSRAEMIRKSANPNIRLYVSEWNLTYKDWGNDWRVGLYAGGILNAFERQCDIVEMSCPALFMRKIGVTQSWDNALINFDQSGWFPAGNYVVMKLWRENFAPTLLRTDGPEKPLNFVATMSGEKNAVILKIVNPEKEEAEAVVTLDGSFVPSSAQMQVIAPGSETVKNSINAPDRIKAEAGEAKIDGQSVKFTMPALSAAVVRLSR